MNSITNRRTYHWSLFVLPLLMGLLGWSPKSDAPAPAMMMDVDGCAGRDSTISILTSCLENSVPINLMASLPGNPATGGFWVNVDSVPADLSDSTNVDFAAFPTGSFRFDYIVAADMSCPADTARLTVDVLNLRDVSCRDTINVGLNDSCHFVVRPSQFILLPVMPMADLDTLYEIVLVSQEGALVGDTITPEYAGQTLDAFLRIPGCTENYCMGAVQAMDLRAPRIDSIANPLGTDSLLCYDIDSIFNVTESWQDPTYTYFIGGPVFSDNCTTPEVTVTDNIVYGDCDTSFATLFRTFVAEDGFGQMTDTTIAYPFYVPALVPAAKLPDVKINTCTPAGTPVPPTYPFIINAFGDTLTITENECDHSSGFEDREFILCGGTRKIERIVKLFDWCTDEAINVDTLVILIGDFEGPLIDQGADTITVSTAPFACEASFNLEQSVLEDMFALEFSDCSGSIALSTSFLTYGPEVDFWGTPTGDSSFMAVDYPVNRNIVSGIPLGLHGMVINASDACGNLSVDTVYFRVKDFVSPVVQCDDRINVTLNSSGYAQLAATDIDEGTWDNCGLDSLKVRRLVPPICYPNFDRNGNGIVLGDELDDSGYTRFNDPVTNGAYVELFCCDLNALPTVELWAWDIYGNAGFCETELLLEDKFPPTAAAPADTVTTCLDPSLDGTLANFGDATIVGDECGLVQLLELTPVFDLAQCGTGTVTRRFQAVKYLGTVRELRSSVVEQDITVAAVNDYEICMPADVEATCGTDPSIPGVTFAELACDLIAVQVQDVRFDATADECYKIFRTYDVINWCEYDGESEPQIIDRDMDNDDVPGDEGICVLVRPNGITYYDADDDEFNVHPNEKGYWTNSMERPFLASTGYWRYRQIIKVYDAFAPTINAAPQEPFCSINDETLSGCQTLVTYPFSVSENCTNQVEVTVYYDEQADGVEVFELPASTIQGGYPNFVITGFYPLGDHAFIVEASDGCGNTAREELSFSVIDCKAPAPICASDISVELMPTEPTVEDLGMAVVWANDFIRSPIYDCTGQGEQGRVERFSINRAIDPADSTQRSVLLTCDDIGELVEVHIYAWDEAGNGDHCTAYVEVQDNMGFCEPATSIISGAIKTENGIEVENVEVLLAGGEERVTHTDGRGRYAFDRLPSGRNYDVRPGLNEDHVNGVSTFDLILIQKHILGITQLRTPYQLIAADVNNSGGISTLDLIQLRKLILGLGDSFLGNQSWRFVMSDYDFTDPGQPWKEAMPETMGVDALDGEVTLDFMAIKIGDVNGNARVNSSQPPPEVRNDDQLDLWAPDLLVEAGDHLEVPITSEDLKGIQGMQFTLEAIHPDLNIESIRPALLANDHMGPLDPKRLWTFSWNAQPGSQLESATLFTVEVSARADIRLQDGLRLTSSKTPAEAYNEFDELLNVALQWSASGVGDRAFDVLEVAPNPFRDQVRLRFSLPAGEAVHLRIFDVAGRIVHQRAWNGTAGLNDIFIRSEDLAGDGLYLFRLEGDTGHREGRLVLKR
jgi:hypothetical protein